jgi:hypothetical protein
MAEAVIQDATETEKRCAALLAAECHSEKTGDALSN